MTGRARQPGRTSSDVRKQWWPDATLAARLADSLDHWAQEHAGPGHCAHWLDATEPTPSDSGRSTARRGGVADLYFDEEPERQLSRLETDPALTTVFAAVDEKLDLLEADPTDSAVRPRRFSNGLWCLIAYNGQEDWAILWEAHPDLDGDVAIRCLGPATFD